MNKFFRMLGVIATMGVLFVGCGNASVNDEPKVVEEVKAEATATVEPVEKVEYVSEIEFEDLDSYIEKTTIKAEDFLKSEVSQESATDTVEVNFKIFLPDGNKDDFKCLMYDVDNRNLYEYINGNYTLVEENIDDIEKPFCGYQSKGSLIPYSVNSSIESIVTFKNAEAGSYSFDNMIDIKFKK